MTTLPAYLQQTFRQELVAGQADDTRQADAKQILWKRLKALISDNIGLQRLVLLSLLSIQMSRLGNLSMLRRRSSNRL